MKKKNPDQDTINRLLVAKYFLDDIKSLPDANPNRYAIARYVLIAHDAAELSIAGIVNHLGLPPESDKTYLMNYLGLIQKAKPKDKIPGRAFFSQLNSVRNDFKHKGIFPDKQQWFRVGDTTYKYISDCCIKYLKISLDNLDESDMLIDSEAKKYYTIAKKLFSQDDYQKVLENLAFALYYVFEQNQALRNLVVGKARVEDAIKLSSFGVHANEYLGLPEKVKTA